MNLKQRVYPSWSSEATLGAAETVHVVQAAPGAGKQLVVTRVAMEYLTAAAQLVNICDHSATHSVMKIPASSGTPFADRYWERGLFLNVNEALEIQPAAAGPSVHVYAEGYIVPQGAV